WSRTSKHTTPRLATSERVGCPTASRIHTPHVKTILRPLRAGPRREPTMGRRLTLTRRFSRLSRTRKTRHSPPPTPPFSRPLQIPARHNPAFSRATQHNAERQARIQRLFTPSRSAWG